MVEAVGDYKILGMQLEVVCHNLIEDALRDLDVGRLELNDHPRLEHPVVEHAVGSEILSADAERDLIGE